MALPGRLHVFTNGPREYVARVLARLGVDDLFDRRFDIRHAEFVPKPDPHPYRRALEALARRGPRGRAGRRFAAEPGRRPGLRDVDRVAALAALDGRRRGGKLGRPGGRRGRGRRPGDGPAVILERLSDLPAAWAAWAAERRSGGPGAAT